MLPPEDFEGARARLAARQAELVAALTGRGADPASFDSERLRVTRAALDRKREHALLQAWPRLRQELGERWTSLYRAYAAGNSLPLQGGPLADGRAFVRWLARAETLSDGLRLQAMAVDLRHRSTSDGLVPRRALALQLVLRRRPRRLVLALRLPGGQEWWWPKDR